MQKEETGEIAKLFWGGNSLTTACTYTAEFENSHNKTVNDDHWHILRPLQVLTAAQQLSNGIEGRA